MEWAARRSGWGVCLLLGRRFFQPRAVILIHGKPLPVVKPQDGCFLGTTPVKRFPPNGYRLYRDDRKCLEWTSTSPSPAPRRLTTVLAASRANPHVRDPRGKKQELITLGLLRAHPIGRPMGLLPLRPELLLSLPACRPSKAQAVATIINPHSLPLR